MENLDFVLDYLLLSRISLLQCLLFSHILNLLSTLNLESVSCCCNSLPPPTHSVLKRRFVSSRTPNFPQCRRVQNIFFLGSRARIIYNVMMTYNEELKVVGWMC
ncbi:CLUMA_CG018710, isoform A [Clunio marinus]|uniref:CLUMA_CG018710, isoform A n=1 Tax=Clunio marinus TaxID=568069 RepID=A0A1J1J2K3_9DIPT|nr:CLUMA_CG018710, isoform A [Clunio marinus]